MNGEIEQQEIIEFRQSKIKLRIAFLFFLCLTLMLFGLFLTKSSIVLFLIIVLFAWLTYLFGIFFINAFKQPWLILSKAGIDGQFFRKRSISNRPIAWRDIDYIHHLAIEHHSKGITHHSHFLVIHGENLIYYQAAMTDGQVIEKEKGFFHSKFKYKIENGTINIPLIMMAKRYTTIIKQVKGYAEAQPDYHGEVKMNR